MKSQATVALGQALECIESETPIPKAKEVLLEMNHCGVCHSDLHLHDGYFDMGAGRRLQVKSDEELPMVLGHEIEGRVAALGPGVRGIELGKSYAVYPWIGCGSCEICVDGREHLCTRAQAIGNSRAGGFSDYVLVPDAKYLLDYGKLDPALAACYMCSGITAYSALRKLEHAAKEGPWMIVGLGGVGMMALQLALHLFDRPPIVADIDDRKLEFARQLGVTQVYQLSDEGVHKRIKKESGGLAGLVDFVGSDTTLNPAISMMRQGGTIVVVGLMGGALQVSIPILPWKALTIQGSYVGSLSEARELLALAQHADLKPVNIELQPLGAASSVLDRMRQGKLLGRVVLQPE